MNKADFVPTLSRTQRNGRRLFVAAGLGVSLAPACVATVAIPGAVYREVHATSRTTIDLGIKTGPVKTLTGNSVEIAREYLA